MKATPPRTLLGPQRLKPSLADAVRDHAGDGRIATITAGWQERESDDQELHQHLNERTRNLELYRRARRVFAADPALRKVYRRRQEVLRQAQELYRVRLGHAMNAVFALLSRNDDSLELRIERGAALDAVRDLDRHQLERTAAIHAEYERRVGATNHPGLDAERSEIHTILADCAAVAIAGGHVALLLNRLQMFDIASALEGLPLFAWSAGAMAVSDRIVLFHDSPPQGPGYPEILDRGLGLCPGIVTLPHAHRRLQLGDSTRVALLAGRFAPASCLALEDGARLDVAPILRPVHGILRLTPDGAVVRADAA